jgi:hypothetical protein
VAAGLRRAIGVEIEQVAGNYGEFTVLVDGEPVIAAGALGFLGVLPGARAIRRAIEQQLNRAPTA